MRTQAPAHVYAIGELVSLDFHDGQFFSKLNPFTVEALLPPVGTSLQYRLKSGFELCRRVVPEHRLKSFEDRTGASSVVFASSHSDADG